MKIQNCAVVKDRCKEVLLEALGNNHGDLFDMLDPLVSDNQCHMHSLLLLNILLKCYMFKDCSYDVNFLSSDDIDILSCAVLLSFFKAVKICKFNFIVREVSLDNFLNYFDSKNIEKGFIASLKAKFNSESVRLLKSLAQDEVKCILEACTAFRLYSGRKLQLLPVYATLFPIFTYLKENRLPILIVLRRIERKLIDADLKHRLHSTDILFFKLVKGNYCLCDTVNDNEKFQPTIAFSCYSCIGYGPSDKNYLSKFQRYCDDSTFPSRMFFKNCDIINLLMMSMTDYQLLDSPSLAIPKGFNNGQTYAETMYKSNSTKSIKTNYELHSEFDLHSTNVYEKYIGHYNLACDCCSGGCTRYCEVVDGKIRRTDANIFFASFHVYVSNYQRECCRQIWPQSLVGQTETYVDYDKEGVTLEVLKILGFDPKQAKQLKLDSEN